MKNYSRYLRISNVLLVFGILLALLQALRLLDVLRFDYPQDLFTPAVIAGLLGMLLNAWASRKLAAKDASQD